VTTYDVIVVGAGAGGGIVAGVLAEAGHRVLVLERGRQYRVDEVGLDHLRNHRLARYGHNTGPDLDGNPRVAVDIEGAARLLRPHEGGYHNNAMAVGGGTLVYGAQAWRFLPRDFRMASTYGVPPGSSLADWPISYDDLAEDYARAEREIGVAGDAAAACFHPRREPYPMPAVADNPQRHLLAGAAARLGWNTHPVPLAINTVPYQGRPACVQCGMCVGFACPSDSKNGTFNTLLPRARASGRCTLVANAQAERVLSDASGRVVGVAYWTIADGRAQRHEARADRVVLSAGAIESARLLLNSPTAREPAGLGNGHDQVGRSLQGHYYPGALAVMPDAVYDGNGPGVTIATTQFNHGNPGIIGGAMLANEFIPMPLSFWYAWRPADAPRWGLAAKRAMRDGFRRTVSVQGPVQEIPSPTARVTIDPAVRDRFGIPVVRLSGHTHPETLRTAAYMRDRAIDWLRATAAERVWARPIALGLSAGQHQAGTCRMGDDARTSVCDRFGRVHGHDNLLVADGGLHVTNGGFNPVLTIMALAFRVARRLITT